jgi:hypothetical protein
MGKKPPFVTYQQKAPPKRGFFRPHARFAITRHVGQPRLDLSASAAGDPANMGEADPKIKSQTQARPYTGTDLLHNLWSQNANIINALATIPAIEQ